MDTLNKSLPWRIFPKQIEATYYNRIRLALLRLGDPLRVSLTQHRGLDVIVHNDYWLCVDSAAQDQQIMAWREFEIHARENLFDPIECKLWLYHHCSGLIMGSALDDLYCAIDHHLGHHGET